MNRIDRFQNLGNKRVAKFLAVGVLNTMFGYGIYAGLLMLNFPYLIALFMATFIGVIFNYFSFGRMVFKASGGWLMFAKFILSYTVVYVINASLLHFLTAGNYLNAYIAQCICIFPSVTISWLLMNFWVYRKRALYEK
jgi:putative flippase GtrA